jgi:D-arabinose 5-phosphate isomerase GutQ
MKVIRVSPIQGGWSVDYDTLAEAMVFRSGGRAEAAARKIASTLAQNGEEACVVIADRSEREAGRQVYRPAL